MSGQILLDGRAAPGADSGYAVPPPLSFGAIFGGAQQTYFHGGFDEAVRHSREDALLMERDSFLMGMLLERQEATSSLRWHLEVDNERDPEQKRVKDHLQNSFKSIPHIHRQLFMPLLQAIWFGRAGCQAVWEWKNLPLLSTPPTQQQPPQPPPVPGAPPMEAPPPPMPIPAAPVEIIRTLCIKQLAPVNGDKIGHRYSGMPYIHVNIAESEDLPNAATITTTLARGLLLKGTWRDRFILHAHRCEDRDYFSAEQGDALYGVGIRSVIFWHDWLKRELLAWLVDYLERFGLGITLIRYPAGSVEGKKAAEKIADDLLGRKTAVLVPWTPGELKPGEDIVRLETPSGAAEVILKLMKVFEGYIRYFITGEGYDDQEGSRRGGDEARTVAGVRARRTRLDALNLADSLTQDLVGPALRWTFPWVDFPVRWSFDIDTPNVAEQIKAANTVWEMGVELKSDEVRGVIGFSKPDPGDDVVSKGKMLELEASLKPLPDPNRTPEGKFDTHGGSAEDEPPGGGPPEKIPSEANGAPAPPEPATTMAARMPGEADQFVRKYVPGRHPHEGRPEFEDAHSRQPAGEPLGPDAEGDYHSSNPRGGDFDTSNMPHPPGSAGYKPPKAPAPKGGARMPTPKGGTPKPAPKSAKAPQPQPAAPPAPPGAAPPVPVAQPQQPAAPVAAPVPAPQAKVQQVAAGVRSLFEGIQTGQTTGAKIDAFVADAKKNLSTAEMGELLTALNISGKAKSKGDAAAKVKQVLDNNLEMWVKSTALDTYKQTPGGTPPPAPPPQQPAAPQAAPATSLFPPDNQVRTGGDWRNPVVGDAEKALAKNSVLNAMLPGMDRIKALRESPVLRALNTYMGTGHERLNEKLRHGDDLDEDDRGMYDGLKQAFKDAAVDLPQPTQVTRGMSLKPGAHEQFMKNVEMGLQTGMPVRPGGFVSTSFDMNTAVGGFAGIVDQDETPVVMEIIAKRGLYLDDSRMGAERELLLDDDAAFKVHAIKDIQYHPAGGFLATIRTVQLEQV